MNLLVRNRPADELIPVSWEGIRKEYFKVWADFPLTTTPFGIFLTHQQRNSLGHMLVAMDVIDTAIDCTTCPFTRQQFSEAILSWMQGDNTDIDDLQVVDLVRLRPLKEIITKFGSRAEFLQAAANVFLASEGKRNAKSTSELLRHLVDEGHWAAEMTICILGTNTNNRLNDFLVRIMRIGTIVDTWLDFRDDSDRGLLQLTPGLLFQMRIVFAIIRQVPGLVVQFPRRRFLWRYCISYLSTNPAPLTHPQVTD